MDFAFLAWPCTGRPKHTSGFLHSSGTTASVLHLFGGLEGTGGLSIVGAIAGTAQTLTAQTLTPDWVVVHVVDNGQVQTFIDTGEASPCRIALPLIWSPAWYAQQTVVRQAPRQIGKRLLHANGVDEGGEYLIFSGTEEHPMMTRGNRQGR